MSKEYTYCLLIIIFLLKGNDDKMHLKHLPLCTLRLHMSTGNGAQSTFQQKSEHARVASCHQRIAPHYKQILLGAHTFQFTPASPFAFIFFNPLSSKSHPDVKIFYMDLCTQRGNKRVARIERVALKYVHHHV